MDTSKTSRKQVPALFRKIGHTLSGFNLDIGGGKYNEVSKNFDNFLNWVYDPHSRTQEENRVVLETIGVFGINSITISNVLNVIQLDEEIVEVLNFAKTFCVSTFITVYEGDKSGVGCITRDGYQRNQKLRNYLPIVQQIWENCYIKNGIIFCP